MEESREKALQRPPEFGKNRLFGILIILIWVFVLIVLARFFIGMYST